MCNSVYINKDDPNIIKDFVHLYSLPDDRKAIKVFKRDENRLHKASVLLKTRTKKEILSICLPSVSSATLQKISNDILYVHIGLLITAPQLLIRLWLRKEGYNNTLKVYPSVLVKERLYERYKKLFPKNNEIPVSILKANLYKRDLRTGAAADYHQIEIFNPTPKRGSLSGVFIDSEVEHEYEYHYAFVFIDKNVLFSLDHFMLDCGYMPDGRGYNINEDVTTIYFMKLHKNKKTRVELMFPGKI